MASRYAIIAFALSCIVAGCLCFPTMEAGSTCGYESCNKEKPGMLNVHLVPHTHDDVGWIITVDEYYYKQVQFILDGVVKELLADPSKRFIYVEQAFFSRWYSEKSEATQKDVKMLVNQGRLEFILGGWSMNDEAATHYTAIIDNHKLGFEFLRQTFGECARPKIGWQIDPFGHSREQASLFAQFGFDGLFFGRLDYQDKNHREQTKTMEFVWEASPNNLGPKANLFTGVLPNGYNPPEGFCFDITCFGFNPMIKDDPKLHDYNVLEMVDQFLLRAREQAESYRTQHLIMTMGSDFNYVQAHMFYSQMDKLIKYVNARQVNGSGVNLLYSTPSCYLKQLNNDNLKWTTKQDDFFPYADRAHTFWTGYFTSRPALKLYSRLMNSYFQSSKQIAALSGSGKKREIQSRLQRLAEVVAVSEHHDSITGSSKQAVAFDYAQRLYEGYEAGKVVIQNSYDRLMPRSDSDHGPQQVFCSQLNVSYCFLTETAGKFEVSLYNPLVRPVSYTVKLPVSGAQYSVLKPDGTTALPHDIFPISSETERLRPISIKTAKNELIFNAQVPALGYATYFVQQASSSDSLSKKAVHSNELIIKGKYITVAFNSQGHLTSMTNSLSNAKVPLEQNFLYYAGHPGKCVDDSSKQPSGAYIFRPAGPAVNISLTKWEGVYKGSLVQEARQKFSEWVSQVVRVYNDRPYVEMEWTIGPIPIGDNIGKEVVTRYSIPSWGNKGVFYTDSNGREILERKLNYRPTWSFNNTEPVAGNYFPINALISSKSGNGDLQFTVLTDRSNGGSSLNDGDVEIMLHRRLLYDDCKGVGEALNETGVSGKGLVVRGKHYLLLERTSQAAAQYRTLAQELFLQPQITFSQSDIVPQQYVKQYNTQWSGLSNQLPASVHLLTLEVIPGAPPAKPLSDDTVAYLIRLEHFYEKGEDANLSKPVTFDLQGVLSSFKIVGVHELALGGNVLASDVDRLQWQTEGGEKQDISKPLRFKPDHSTVLTLGPMEIVTLQIDVKSDD